MPDSPNNSNAAAVPDTLDGVIKPDERSYLNCIRCGLCLVACPTYREYLTETASPRGRVALARMTLEGRLQLSPNLSEQMYGCFACMACSDICPVGIRPAELALSMRHVQEQIDPAAWKGPLFGGVVSHPRRMELATLPLRLYEGFGIRRLVRLLRLDRALSEQIRDLEAMLPPVPAHPLRRVLPEVTAAFGEQRYRVGFFLGCAQSLLFAEQSAATVRVLARNGCAVITPNNIECCGMPARGYGRIDLVERHARHNIAVFERAGADVIITDCATCGSTLKEYDALLANDAEWAMRAEAFSRKVRDVSEFLADIPLRQPTKRVSKRVTYHDPCHLRRAQRVWKQPRNLLANIDGLELVELPEADWCCGSAGSQLITHHETSLKVLNRKLDNIANTKCEVVASGCPGCRMQLNAGIGRRGLNVAVVHPVQLLDEAYGDDDGQQTN